ncbi:AMP-binding protein [Arthrobacter sp. H35-D1]|uniref:class I adenylate-forming enzyme family protein n=1 Tax=Arthrobacter sp. H35-D1 TaxID=3046202 RepID=UPI0024B8D3DB|nr:AMP-binding protein [Arthrobacter sp. H35-D1]MDJ0315002.1 AMP-binding protein [Arthrobacter sp. H35-D1]
MPFIDKLRYWAKNDGGRAALSVGGPLLTYAELLQAAEAGATGSAAAEGPARSVAAIDRPTSVELVIDFCAALLRGRTAMVMDTGWPATLRRQLTESAEMWAGSHDFIARPFLLGLSSGTSGLPKAFVRSAVSWSESFVRSTEYFNLGATSVTLAPGPLAASMNLYALGESIHAGSTFVALPRFSPDAALDAMAEHPVNRLVLVPTLLEMMAARGMETGRDGGQLESIVCAGSALPERTLALTRQWAPNALVQHYYGAAELGFVAASTVQPATIEPSTGAGVGTAAVGTAFPGVEISIRDDHGHEAARGQQGNICVRSPYVCSGYAWGDDGLAFSPLSPSPLSSSLLSPGSLSPGLRASEPQTTQWHTVHDQGHVDGNGVLHVAGRASEMIIRSGANVYPHAVEEGLAAGCDEAATVVVTGVADPLRGQRIAAGIFVPEGGGHLDVAALRRAAALLPAHHRPGLYFSLGAMPLTGSGKPSRALLGQWITEGDARAQRIR